MLWVILGLPFDNKITLWKCFNQGILTERFPPFYHFFRLTETCGFDPSTFYQ